jgi:hypothetical protein
MLLSLAVSVPPSLVPKGWGKISSPLPLRNPEKFSVALVFALAIVAGLALDRLRVKERRPRWPLVTAAVLTVLALTAALAPGPAARAAVMISGDDRWVEIASREIPRALAEGAILWTATVIALDCVFRRSRAAWAVALALLTLVPIVANRRIARTLTELELFSPTRFARLLQRSDPSGSYRTFGESLYSRSAISEEYAWPDDVFSENGRRSWIQHVQALWGRGTVFNNDFDVGDLSRVQSIRRIAVMAAGYTDSQAFFGSLALRWGIRFRDQKPLAGYRRVGGDALQDWDLLDAAEPDIRLATGWVEERGGLPALEVLPKLGSGQIVVETGRRLEGRARPGLLHVLRKDPERLMIETVSSDPSWLFVLRGFWHHRTVLLDGRPVEYVPAQLAFSAVPVPAGRHRIDWRERVPGGEISRWGPVAYLLFAAALFFSARGRRRP